MDKPSRLSGNYDQDFLSKPPISQRNFIICLRALTPSLQTRCPKLTREIFHII